MDTGCLDKSLVCLERGPQNVAALLTDIVTITSTSNQTPQQWLATTLLGIHANSQNSACNFTGCIWSHVMTRVPQLQLIIHSDLALERMQAITTTDGVTREPDRDRQSSQTQPARDCCFEKMAATGSYSKALLICNLMVHTPVLILLQPDLSMA